MIDFACKKFNLNEVIMCSLSLTKTEFGILTFLLRNNGLWLSAGKISTNTGLGLSTVQKAVAKLSKAGVLIQSKKNLGGGGYLYLYKVKDKQIIREKILSIVRKWTQTVEDQMREW